ncbi:MAG: Gfo/Idh/MocA family oxidoreductase [Lachnospiraceae bacterium]|nr:Gfo/Idh/MocA family oxidoreductase [Lachnospiraceae bacterium]
MEQVRAAVIGFGGMGRQYAKMIYDGEIEGMTLAGVCCRNQEGQAVLRNEYPGISIYQNVEEMLTHPAEYDAAVIVTPHTSHVEIGLQMVKAGKHILMDKPAGVCAKEVNALIQAAEEAHVSFGMIFNNRENPVFVKAKEMLDAGALGRIQRAVWVCNTWYRTPAYHHSAPWRSSWNGERGGLLINQSQHYLDLWQWLLGMPDSVLAVLDYGKYNDFLVDDSAELQFSYRNGIRGTFLTASGEAPGVNRLEIWGTMGRLCIEDTSRLTFYENVMSTDEFAKTNTEIYGMLDYTVKEIPTEKDERGYQKLLANFSAHLRDGVPLLADGREGLKSVVLMNGAYLSSWLERRISLPAEEALYLEMLEEKMEQERAWKEKH